MADPLDRVADGLRSRAAIAGRPVDRTSLRERMEELHVPAVSVAVIEDGVVHARAWGADPAALFQAASISKPVSAIGAVALASDGVFDLDTEVNELLTTWKLPEGGGVTVRRILSHTAGLSVHGFPGYEPDGNIPTTVQILDGLDPANTEAVRVVRPPGEAFQYSGGGFTVLQLLLEDVTGEPFAELMRRVVLDPLEMRASTYEQPLPFDRREQAATGHDSAGEPIAGRWRVHPEQAAAGLWTNPTELVGVAAELLRPRDVLDEARRNEMLTLQMGEFGLGWGLDGAWFQHGGSNEGFRCQLYGSVAHQRAAVVMTNSDSGGVVVGEIIATIAELFGWPDYLKERTAIELDDATMDEMVGEYEIEGLAVPLVVRRVDGVLMSAISGLLPERELFASSETDLFRLDFDAAIGWTGDALTITQAGDTTTARRRT